MLRACLFHALRKPNSAIPRPALLLRPFWWLARGKRPLPLSKGPKPARPLWEHVREPRQRLAKLLTPRQRLIFPRRHKRTPLRGPATAPARAWPRPNWLPCFGRAPLLSRPSQSPASHMREEQPPLPCLQVTPTSSSEAHSRRPENSYTTKYTPLASHKFRLCGASVVLGAATVQA